MKVADFDYYLPQELIAQHPLVHRDQSRLLVYHRDNKKTDHRLFPHIKDYLRPGDCLVINDTRVIPARLYGVREDTGSKVEILLLENKGQDLWEVMVKPGKKAKIGARLSFGDGLLEGEVKDILENGLRYIEFEYKGIFENIIDDIGVMPLPPYIHEKLREKDRYQTVYSRILGSSAAPTAGLHFTQEILGEIEKMGVKIARLTLHVGLGTFQPVKADNIEDHKMHSEYYSVSKEAADTINKSRQNGGRIIGVGTTSTRTLESIADKDGTIQPGSGKTDIFIYPGYTFKGIDALLTNFHLPKSTLIMLVGALMGKEEVIGVYQNAIEEGYRFFSFGDAMLVL